MDQRRLLALLLESPDYRQAYHTLPEFKLYVDSITTILPAILKAAHDNATEAAGRREQMLRHVMHWDSRQLASVAPMV